MDNRIDAIYGRQSIDKKDSISIESQFEFCRYELKGGEGREYKDKGYSGKNIERPDFQRLLQDIKLGLIKRVIVYKLDRISRSIVDFAKLMELFKQYDVEFVSCTEKFDTSTPMGRAMLNMKVLRPDEQRLLEGKYFLGYDDNRLSEICECSPGSVRMKLTRARRKILNIMEREVEMHDKA